MLISGIAREIGGGYPESSITNPTFNCANVDDKYITFTGALLATQTHSVTQLLESVEKWVREEPKLDSLNIVVDTTCSVRISTLNSTCEARVVAGAIAPQTGAASSATFGGLIAALLIVVVIAVCLGVVVVVLIILLKSKKNVNCPPSENAKVK